jgi:serine/threonine protein kinase
MGKPSLQRVEELFHRTADLAPAEQAALLDAECGGDAELRAAVEELLRNDPGTQATDHWLASPIERATSDLPLTAVHSSAAAIPRLRPDAIAGYEILDELGSGGMGVVFKARQTALQRLVALKMLRRASPVTAEQIARLRTEAEALARLQHPNIVQVHEIGEHEGRPYLVMEYVAGPDLARRLAGRPQRPRDAARLVEVLARAVQAVHDCGIIHRDLKPGNILVQESGDGGQGSEVRGDAAGRADSCLLSTDSCLKITDFGLAVDPATMSRLTQPGMAVGTPCYMAPEQARGRAARIGPAVDIYALGSILYEALTGRPPFGGAGPEETVAQLLLEEPISPARLRPGLPRDLVTICLKCLEKDPRRRYARAADLADDLERFRESRPIQARPVGPFGRTWRWCRRRPLVATLATLLALLAAALVVTVVVYEMKLQAALAGQLEQTEQRLTVKENEAEEERHELMELDRAFGLRLMREGDTFTALLWFTEALRRDGGGAESPYRTSIGAALRQSPRLVQFRTCDQPVCCAALGAAGCWAVSVDTNGVVGVLDMMAGRPVGPGFTPERGSVPVGISPDGRLIATAAPAGTIQIWKRDSGKPDGRPLRHDGPVTRASFSADNRLLFVQDTHSISQPWDLAGRRRKSLEAGGESSAVHAACSEDGRWLWTIHAGNRGRMWDATTGKAVWPALDLGRRIVLAAPHVDGRQVALLDEENNVRLLDAGTGRSRLLAQLPPVEGVVDGLHLSRDGSRVLTVAGNQVRVWAAASGQSLTPPLWDAAPLLAAGFAGERRLVMLGKDGVMKVWELPDQAAAGDRPHAEARDERSLPQLLALARVLSGRRLESRGQPVALDRAELRSAWEGGR